MKGLSKVKIIQLCKNKRVLLLTHEHADLDSFCSAAMFQRFLNKQKITSTIAIPSHINEQAKHISESLKINYISNPDLTKFDVVLIFDLNSFEQLGVLKEYFTQLMNKKLIEVIVFDHHVSNKTCIVTGGNCVLDETMFSTTQLIYNFLDTSNNKSKSKDFDSQMYFLNCVGLLEDTGHFIVSSPKAFSDFAISLKKSNKTYADVLSFTKNEFDNGERIALLKAAQRSQITQIKEIILITSTVSFYQSFVATKLLNFGAHISLVSGIEKSKLCVLSARADSLFKEKNNFNLVKDLFIPLKEKLGGEIGGHSGAAQWKGVSTPEEVLSVAREILKNRL
jgi:bifunctional oligoribonuclease and PAP phosphatase NrnA